MSAITKNRQIIIRIENFFKFALVPNERNITIKINIPAIKQQKFTESEYGLPYIIIEMIFCKDVLAITVFDVRPKYKYKQISRDNKMQKKKGKFWYPIFDNSNLLYI